MVKLNKERLKDFVDKGFFDTFKTIGEVVEKLDQKGFSISGKKVGLLAQLLTFLCQEDTLERKKDDKGKWSYKKA